MWLCGKGKWFTWPTDQAEGRGEEGSAEFYLGPREVRTVSAWGHANPLEIGYSPKIEWHGWDQREGARTLSPHSFTASVFASSFIQSGIKNVKVFPYAAGTLEKTQHSTSSGLWNIVNMTVGMIRIIGLCTATVELERTVTFMTKGDVSHTKTVGVKTHKQC